MDTVTETESDAFSERLVEEEGRSPEPDDLLKTVAG